MKCCFLSKFWSQFYLTNNILTVPRRPYKLFKLINWDRSSAFANPARRKHMTCSDHKNIVIATLASSFVWHFMRTAVPSSFVACYVIDVSKLSSNEERERAREEENAPKKKKLSKLIWKNLIIMLVCFNHVGGFSGGISGGFREAHRPKQTNVVCPPQKLAKHPSSLLWWNAIWCASQI